MQSPTKSRGEIEEDIKALQLDSSASLPFPAVTEFAAQLAFVDESPNKKEEIFFPGYKAVLNIDGFIEECEIVELIEMIDIKTRKATKKKPRFALCETVVVCRLRLSKLIAIEDFTSGGLRFKLYHKEMTEIPVALGKVTELASSGGAGAT